MCEYPHVVVTGASSGTGRAVTLCLAASGYHVFAGVRTHAGGVALHQHTPPDAGLITPLLRLAEGRIVLIEPTGARPTPPFAGPLTAMSATLRAELAPWHIDVTLTEPGAAARALTAPRPRATSASPWFGLYDLDAVSSGPL